MSKYKAKRTFYDGKWFDSKREATVAAELMLLKRAGEISQIEYQPTFELLPKPNKIIYKADFKITFKNGNVEIWDVKGIETPVFKLKKKMMKHFYPQVNLKIVM